MISGLIFKKTKGAKKCDNYNSSFFKLSNKSAPNFRASTSILGGFTLIEVMLVVSLLVIIGGISAPFYQAFQVKNDLDVASGIISQTLRRAQVLSQSVDGDSSWGVHIASGSATLFRGATYASRDVSFDEIFEISTNIVPTGFQEIVYSKFYGYPQITGTLTLTSSNNETRALSINSRGLIE